jgi:hypothetical protein
LLPKKLEIKFFLQIIALILTISVFFKAIIDVDIAYDTWIYHLPFAARIWGIIPAEFYSAEEARFDGFPLLGEFFQGFFWWITQHLQAANLFCYFSLIFYCLFLKIYFQIPLYLSAIALWAIPLVQTHVISCYVDLPANLFLSALILLTYLLYSRPNVNNRRNLWGIFITAAVTANLKFQLIPLVFIVLVVALIRIIWLRWQQNTTARRFYRWLLKLIPTVCLASLLIFAVPIKNTIFYGNPFYPVRIEIAGKVLNHKLGLYQNSPGYLENAPRIKRWLYSVLEINRAPWTLHQYSSDRDRNCMGGFFNAYVVFNIILLAIFWLRNFRSQETKIAVIFSIFMTMIAAFSPQSHELRYYMYWMLVLVSLNLYLISDRQREIQRSNSIKTENIALVYLLVLAIVVTKTHFQYIKPNFYTLNKHIDKYVNPEVIYKIQPGDRICLVNKYPYAFLYSSWFHSNLNYQYSLRWGGFPQIGNPNECRGDEKIL